MTTKNATPQTCHLILFVTGKTVLSQAAESGVRKLCADLKSCELKVLDVLDEYQAAVQFGIFATPCLLLQETGTKVVGDLSNPQAVLNALGLRQKT